MLSRKQEVLGVSLLTPC